MIGTDYIGSTYVITVMTV